MSVYTIKNTAAPQLHRHAAGISFIYYLPKALLPQYFLSDQILSKPTSVKKYDSLRLRIALLICKTLHMICPKADLQIIGASFFSITFSAFSHCSLQMLPTA